MESQEARRARLALDLERRVHFRIDCSIVADWRLIDESASGKATLANIGVGGARSEFDQELHANTVLTLSLPPTGKGGEVRPTTLQARVAWTATDDNAEGTATGLQFQFPTPRDREALIGYLIELLD